MNLYTINPVCYHLHRFLMSPIAADITKIRTAFHQHLVPSIKRRMIQWLIEGPVEIHHHFCNALLRGRNSAVVSLQTELSSKRRLNTLTIEDFPFNGGSLNRFVPDQLDSQLFAGTGLQMPDQSRNHSGGMQKTGFPGIQAILLVAKSRPVRLFPIPKHEL